MIVIPLSVFVFIVVFALGGPTEFMRIVSNWSREIGSGFYHWVRSL